MITSLKVPDEPHTAHAISMETMLATEPGFLRTFTEVCECGNKFKYTLYLG
jgi:hypothetical protein